MDEIRKILAYDPGTGIFCWTVTTRNGKRRAGDKAGSRNSEGYWQISVGGKQHKAHRLAWLYVFGEWPSSNLDHINGDRLDNSIANLRLADKQKNAWNRRRHRNNASGYKGVHLHKKTGKWRAVIHSKHLGLFKNADDAHAAYCAAAQRSFGEFWSAG